MQVDIRRQNDEGDQCYAGDSIGFEAVGRRPDAVAGIVAGAVGNYAGIAGIILFDFKDNLHQIRADIGNFGKDAAGNTQGAGAERFTDGKADKAGPGQFTRYK